MPPPGAPPAEPGAPPPPEVPEYGEGEGMAASSWWESMADLRLCGKKVTNEQAKTIFTLMGALIVALVVVAVDDGQLAVRSAGFRRGEESLGEGRRTKFWKDSGPA